MKTFGKQLFYVSIIVILFFGSITPTLVFAQDEQPISTDALATETVTEDTIPTETPEAEQLPTEVENVIAAEATQAPEIESLPLTEDLSDIVTILDNEGMTLTDETGEPIAMASQEASVILSDSDPFFWDGTKWVGYTKSGTGCPTNVTCLSSDTPFQAAITAASALTVDTNIYVATGTYNEDVIINSTKKLSFTGFNSVSVNADSTPPTVTNPGFATLKSLTLNADFGTTSGVYADKVIVNAGGQLNDALTLVNPANDAATIEANLIVYSSGDYYRVKDANNSSTNFEWDCGEPQIPININKNYRMILKNPTDKDVIKYFQDNPDERTLGLTAEQRIDDLILAANMSEQTVDGFTPWSNSDERMVYWNLLGHVKNVLGNASGVTPLSTKQQTYANYITSGLNDSKIQINQELWFLWANGTGQSPKNVQFTFLKYTQPTVTGCTDPAKCKSCPTGQKFTEGVGCEPIVCETGTKLVGNECEPIVCEIGTKLVGNECEPIVCEIGTKLVGNECEPIVCGPDEQLIGNDCVANPSQPVVQAASNLLIPVTGGLQIPVTGTRIIVAGLGHTCMTAGNSEVLCWGLNASGQVGDGTNDNQLKPVFVKDLNEVVDLTAGSLHTCALKSNGEVWCWGENESGQVGNGATTDTSLPVFVDGLPDKAIDITGGEEFTCALLKNMDVWCWGENGLGQLNDGSTINRTKPVKSLLNKLQNAIAAGQEALLGDAAGSVDAWSAEQATLVQEMGNSLFLFGDRWNMGGCAINFNGQVKCWNNDPLSKFIEGSKPAYMVETGINHGCSLNADGTTSCWGDNQYGQLGNGTNQESTSAVLTTGISEAKEIGIGRNHSCVLVGEGNTAMCWGENTYGQLGNDSTIDSNLPVYVLEP
ncbi:MAG: hypothetical protein C0410_04125 [Anaerolinea sp.]|nr:hypothetical protein [Anaerolinea sp.]